MAGAASRGVEYALALVWGEAALQAAEAEGAGPDTRHCILYCTVLYCTAGRQERVGGVPGHSEGGAQPALGGARPGQRGEH